MKSSGFNKHPFALLSSVNSFASITPAIKTGSTFCAASKHISFVVIVDPGDSCGSDVQEFSVNFLYLLPSPLTRSLKRRNSREEIVEVQNR